MKIAYVTDQYWPCVSGISSSIDLFRAELERMGHEVHVLAPEYPGRPAEEAPVIHRFRSARVFFNDENRLVHRGQASRIGDCLAAIAPEIVHVQTEFSMASMATRWARRRHVPLVITAHTNWMDLIHFYMPWLPFWFSIHLCRWKMAFVFGRADAIVVPTSLMDALLASYGIRRPTRVIPTGIRLESLQAPQEPAVPADIHPDLAGRPFLLFIGRLGVEKNVPFLFGILERLRFSRPELCLLVVGDGPARVGLEEEARARGLSRNVLFAGFVPHGSLSAYYAAAEAFVFASKVESQGLVILEAMACGTPVVAIGKMGTREVMGGSHGGFMVEDDPGEFAQAVELLLADPALRERKRLEAREHAEQWSMRVQAQRMEHFYELVCRWKSRRS